MKRNILLLSLSCGLIYLALSSSTAGVGNAFHRNCTNAPLIDPTAVGCGGSGCHDAYSPNVSAVMTMTDVATGNTVNSGDKWVAGNTYNVILKGSAPASFSYFGFQTSTTMGTFLNTYTVGSSTLEVTQCDTLSYLQGYESIENDANDKGTSKGLWAYYQWVAPPAGTPGDSTNFYSAFLADNNDTEPTGDSFNLAEPFFLVNPTLSVKSVLNNAGINTYPNPVSNSLTITMNNAPQGTYGVNVFDLSGRKIASQNFQVSSGSFTGSINTSKWVAGMYQVSLSKDGAQRTITVIKR